MPVLDGRAPGAARQLLRQGEHDPEVVPHPPMVGPGHRGGAEVADAVRTSRSAAARPGRGRRPGSPIDARGRSRPHDQPPRSRPPRPLRRGRRPAAAADRAPRPPSRPGRPRAAAHPGRDRGRPDAPSARRPEAGVVPPRWSARTRSRRPPPPVAPARTRRPAGGSDRPTTPPTARHWRMLETATCRLRTPELNVASGQSASISSSRCSGRPWCRASSMSRQRAFGRSARQPISTPSIRRLNAPRQRSSILGGSTGARTAPPTVRAPEPGWEGRRRSAGRSLRPAPEHRARRSAWRPGRSHRRPGTRHRPAER